MTIFAAFTNVIEFLNGKLTEAEATIKDQSKAITDLTKSVEGLDWSYTSLNEDYEALSDKTYIMAQRLKAIGMVVPHIHTEDGFIEVWDDDFKVEGPIMLNEFKRCHYCGALHVSYHRNGIEFCCKACSDHYHRKSGGGRSIRYKTYSCEVCGEELSVNDIKYNKKHGKKMLCMYHSIFDTLSDAEASFND